MKTISRVALLTALFSLSAPLFSQENIAPTGTPVSTAPAQPTFLNKLVSFPGTALSTLFIGIPQKTSDYTYGFLLNQITKRISYLQNGHIAQNSSRIGLFLVYATIATVLYKVYTKTPGTTNNNDDVFVYDSTDTSNQ